MRTMLLITSSLIVAAIFGTAGRLHKKLALKMQPSFVGATEWLNSEPLNLTDLHGKVVLVDFWTYTCVNWRRTLPYVSEWARKYKGQGLLVVGVHTPEFSFEHTLSNINRSLKDMRIAYPVAVDNNYEVWNSFQNQYWPALYLIDAKGRIRYKKFGEGDYSESELKIQQLLKEVSDDIFGNTTVDLQPSGYEASADWPNLRSHETYLSYGRAEGFLSPERAIPNRRLVYSAPKQLTHNHWAISGEWIIGNEKILLAKAHGKIIYRFHARDVNLIMGPLKEGETIKFRVLLDGKPPGASHGLDVNEDGYGTVSDQRMYQLIRQQSPILDRDFQIEFSAPGLEAYDFSFG